MTVTAVAQVYVGHEIPRGGNVEISGGVAWAAGFDLGSISAEETRNTGTGTGSFVLMNGGTQRIDVRADPPHRPAQAAESNNLLLLLVIQDVAHSGEGPWARRLRQRLGRRQLMAGFAVSINGWIWVSTEGPRSRSVGAIGTAVPACRRSRGSVLPRRSHRPQLTSVTSGRLRSVSAGETSARHTAENRMLASRNARSLVSVSVARRVGRRRDRGRAP